LHGHRPARPAGTCHAEPPRHQLPGRHRGAASVLRGRRRRAQGHLGGQEAQRIARGHDTRVPDGLAGRHRGGQAPLGIPRRADRGPDLRRRHREAAVPGSRAAPSGRRPVTGSRANSLAIAIYAPVGRDASLASDLLGRAGIEGIACKTFAQLEEQLQQGVGAILLTEEELNPPRIARLSEWSRAQPSWSDLPIVVFSSLPGGTRLRAISQLQEAANVSFVDRPVQRRTFLAAMRSALRARERQYESRRAIEARDQFLAMLGHELRNPLSAVRFATDLIMRQNVPDPWVAKHAATIERQTAHLNRLVDDLLDVARVTSGKVILRKEPTGLGPLVQRCVESLHGMAVAQGVSLTRRPESGAVLVDGDAIRLEQVVCNLVTNALKYTPRGGHVEVSVSGRSGAAVLVVRDDGIGIPPDQLDSIFEVFNQAPTSLD